MILVAGRAGDPAPGLSTQLTMGSLEIGLPHQLMAFPTNVGNLLNPRRKGGVGPVTGRTLSRLFVMACE